MCQLGMNSSCVSRASETVNNNIPGDRLRVVQADCTDILDEAHDVLEPILKDECVTGPDTFSSM